MLKDLRCLSAGRPHSTCTSTSSMLLWVKSFFLFLWLSAQTHGVPLRVSVQPLNLSCLTQLPFCTSSDACSLWQICIHSPPSIGLRGENASSQLSASTYAVSILHVFPGYSCLATCPPVAVFLDFQWWAEFKYALICLLQISYTKSTHILFLYLVTKSDL